MGQVAAGQGAEMAVEVVEDLSHPVEQAVEAVGEALHRRFFETFLDPAGEVPGQALAHGLAEYGLEPRHHLFASAGVGGFGFAGMGLGGLGAARFLLRLPPLLPRREVQRPAVADRGHQDPGLQHHDPGVEQGAAKIRAAGVKHRRKGEIQRQVMHGDGPGAGQDRADVDHGGQGGQHREEIHVGVDLPGVAGEGHGEQRRLPDQRHRDPGPRDVGGAAQRRLHHRRDEQRQAGDPYRRPADHHRHRAHDRRMGPGVPGEAARGALLGERERVGLPRFRAGEE